MTHKPPERKVWTLRDLRNLFLDNSHWIDDEIAMVEDVHHYAHEFGASPGSNVFEFLLKDALAHHDMTIAQLREKWSGR